MTMNISAVQPPADIFKAMTVHSTHLILGDTGGGPCLSTGA